jgi:hypothetical protein
MFDALAGVMMTEHRLAARHRVLKTATIEFGGGAIDCTIRNMSNAGAALDVASPLDSGEDKSESASHSIRVGDTFPANQIPRRGVLICLPSTVHTIRFTSR